MATFKITALTELSSGDLADADVFAIVDITADETKKISYSSIETKVGTAIEDGSLITGLSYSNGLTLTSQAAGHTPLTVDAHASQSANIVDICLNGTPAIEIDQLARIIAGGDFSSFAGSLVTVVKNGIAVAITDGGRNYLAFSRTEMYANNDIAVRQYTGTQTGIVFKNGKIELEGVPTSSAGLASGEIWNDSGTLKIV